MFKDVDYDRFAAEVNMCLKNGGAFLNTKGEKPNTMVIGWGGVNIIWRKPIFLVMVRGSRYTYELIEKSGEFTVSVPVGVNLKEALSFCGTESGRNYDKFRECGLTPIDGKIVGTPVIGECTLHYECRIVYKQEMKVDGNIDQDIHNRFYPQHDYHTFYFGEILACYADESLL